jgi:hypothetical protein
MHPNLEQAVLDGHLDIPIGVDAGEFDPDDDPRETDVETVDERGMLLDYLRHYRLTMEMKCAGLDAEQLARRSVPPSTMSLLGLVRHLAEGSDTFAG